MLQVFGGENDRPLVDTTLDRRVSAIGSGYLVYRDLEWIEFIILQSPVSAADWLEGEGGRAVSRYR